MIKLILTIILTISISEFLFSHEYIDRYDDDRDKREKIELDAYDSAGKYEKTIKMPVDEFNSVNRDEVIAIKINSNNCVTYEDCIICSEPYNCNTN